MSEPPARSIAARADWEAPATSKESFVESSPTPRIFTPSRGFERMPAATSVCAVTGELSPAYMLRLTDRLQELLPNAERTVIPGASHGMTEENPDVVNERILGFLARRMGSR